MCFPFTEDREHGRPDGGGRAAFSKNVEGWVSMRHVTGSADVSSPTGGGGIDAEGLGPAAGIVLGSRNGLDVVATLNIRVAGERIELRERTAEKISLRDEVSGVFGKDDARGLITGPIESADLDLRNVSRWERIAAVTQ